jgi:hypothetical protein
MELEGIVSSDEIRSLEYKIKDWESNLGAYMEANANGMSTRDWPWGAEEERVTGRRSASIAGLEDGLKTLRRELRRLDPKNPLVDDAHTASIRARYSVKAGTASRASSDHFYNYDKSWEPWKTVVGEGVFFILLPLAFVNNWLNVKVNSIGTLPSPWNMVLMALVWVFLGLGVFALLYGVRGFIRDFRRDLNDKTVPSNRGWQQLLAVIVSIIFLAFMIFSLFKPDGVIEFWHNFWAEIARKSVFADCGLTALFRQHPVSVVQ